MRTSPIYYIEPSAISIIANANESSQDLAVNVDRGTKIKVCYQPIAGLGYNNANYKEWSFRGRNRRLKEADKPYTIYARLNKTNQTDGYLVFAEQVVDQETGEWTDPYILSPNTSATSPVRLEGADGEKYMWGAIPERQAADRRSGYWWVKLGTVSLPGEDGRRTVDLDTGILGTAQYNADWYLDPDKMPKRPVRVIPVERGNWSPAPTVTYTGESGSATPDGTLSIAIADELGWNGTTKISVTQGQRISEPYHYSHLTRNRWLTHRLAEYNSGLTDAELYEKLTTASRGWEEENWLETSRVWHGGRLWECLTEGTASEPGDDNPDWELLLHSGVDGSGIEFIYYLGTTDPATGQTPAPSTPASSGNGTVNGEVTAYTPYIDDWVPEGWTDSPQGISHENQIEWISQRTSSPTNGDDNGGHQWSGFSRPEIWSKWGRNGQDGDGVEYVYVRTKDDTAPVISDSSDTYEGKTYLDDDYLPLTSAGRATDNPKGTTRDWPYEWVIKRTKGLADPETGERTWEKYAGEMKMWSTYAAMRLSIDNPMSMVPTDSDGKILADFTVETTVRLYDGAKEVAIDAALIEVTGAPGADIATQHTEAQGNGLRMMWTFAQGQTMADTYGISITYTYNKTTYYGVFTIAASKNTAVWQLKPDKTTVVFRRNGDNSLTPASHAVGLVLIRIDSSGSAEFAQVQDGMSVRYSAVAMPLSPSDGAAWTSGNIPIYNTDDNLFIALFGSNGALLDRKTVAVVRDGAAGNAYEVTCSANSFILNQQEYEPYEIEVAGAETSIDVTLDGVQQSWRIVSVSYDVDVYNGAGTYGYNEIMTSWSGVAGVGAKTVGVTYVKNNIKQAHLLITIEYGEGQQRTLRIIIACNLLGSWKQKIIGDAENVWAEKSTYTYTDDEGKEHTITLQQFYANYTRSSSENSAKFREIVSVLNTDGEGTTPTVTEENYAQYLQRASEAYSQIQKDIYNDDGSIATKLTKFVQTADFVGLFAKKILNDPEGTATLEGYVQAEADKVSLGIKNGLDSTGIDIENHIIRLNGDTVINGDLLLNSEEQGFLLTGNGGVTRIAPKSIGTYSDVLSKANEYSTFWTSFPVITDSNGGYSSSFVTIKSIDGISPANVEIVSRGFSCSVYRVSSDVALTGKSIAVSKVGSTQIEAQVAWTSSPYPNKEMIVHIYVQVKVSFTMNTLIGYDGISIIMGRDPSKVAYFGSEGTHIRYAGYELVCSADGVGYIDDGSGQDGQYGNVFKFGQKRWRLVYGSLDINDINDPCDIYIMKQSGFTVTLPTGNYWLNKEITIINGSDGTVRVSGNINGQQGRVMPIEDRYEAWVYVNISGEWFGSYRPTGGIGGGGGSDTPVSLQNLNIYNANGGLVLSFNGTAAKTLNLSAAMVGAMASTYAVGRGLVVSGNTIYLTDQNGNMLGSQQTLPSGSSADTSNCIKNDTTSEQTIKGNLRLENVNYGNRLLFGDGTYVYFEEDYDDHLKLYSRKGLTLQAPNAQDAPLVIEESNSNNSLVIEGYSSGSVKRLISFPGKNSNENYIGHVDSGSWGDGMQITTNDLEMNGGYHISMFTPASFGTYTYIVLDAYNGTVSASHAITVGSDRRMKDELENITDMPIDWFADAPLVKFCYKNDTRRTPHIGSYAQYFEDILPETVSEAEDPVTKEKHLSLDYTGVTVAGVITAAREIVALKKEVAEKDAMIKNLERDLADERERRDNIEQRLKRVEELLFEMMNEK